MEVWCVCTKLAARCPQMILYHSLTTTHYTSLVLWRYYFSRRKRKAARPINCRMMFKGRRHRQQQLTTRVRLRMLWCCTSEEDPLRDKLSRGISQFSLLNWEIGSIIVVFMFVFPRTCVKMNWQGSNILCLVAACSSIIKCRRIRPAQQHSQSVEIGKLLRNVTKNFALIRLLYYGLLYYGHGRDRDWSASPWCRPCYVSGRPIPGDKQS